MKKNALSIRDFEKNKENPFLLQAVEQVQENIVKKYKTASKTGEKAVLQAIDKDTGEVLGHTQFIRQIEVDEEQFTKFYLSNFSKFFDLPPASLKIFGYIMGALVPKKDMFFFFMEDCMEYTGYKSERSIHKGLAYLLKAQIIARGRADNIYFINPMVAFNGDRITFTKTFVKAQKPKPKKVVFEKESQIVNSNQTSLLDMIKEIENE